VETAENGAAALSILEEKDIATIISDLQMPEMDGLELFNKIKPLQIPVIIITAFGTIERAVDAMKQGVFDFISKPFDEDNLVQVTRKALSVYNQSRKDAGGGLDQIFFNSENDHIKRIQDQVQQVVRTNTSILLTGESGTGKGVLADLIHQASPQAKNPFIKINLAAIPENLLESELFGFEKGAFTGAVTAKPGKFELAHQGTLFLDEVGELPLLLQSKILTAIQDKEITRVGDLTSKQLDCRLVFATNRDLQQAVSDKSFREDLYYRLNVIEFKLPPLRERLNDIPPLVGFFNDRYANEFNLPAKTYEKSAFSVLQTHSFPGNIRELENIVQKVILIEKDIYFIIYDKYCFHLTLSKRKNK